MTDASPPPRTDLPSIDRLMRSAALASHVSEFGRDLVVECARTEIADVRRRLSEGDDASADTSESGIVARIGARLRATTRPSLMPVFNLTGTVLHTNLGRAALPRQALDAVVAVSSGASNLEYDLDQGRRGDRDSHLEALLCRLTGAEAATVVNNNAAAVLLVLNALALRKEVPVSRGELIEIGGAFRMPDIMARAGCKLQEVGTTNRTHLRDFETAISAKTALLMTVHTSNYEVQGFTAAVPEADLAALAHRHDLPFVVDLGSGTLVDLANYGLPHERTPAEAIADGADIVTFSGDKLLGGPQAGIIVGRRDMIAKLRRNPLKRALRLDKMTIAALSAVLQLYLDPDRLTENLPTLRALARPLDEIAVMAERLAPVLQTSLDGVAEVACEPCHSQIGSGALPVDLLPSMALVVRPVAGRGRGALLKRVAAAFRALPQPVIGRIQNHSFQLDLRCLEDEPGFVDQMSGLAAALGPAR
ncbi:MAG: L-seryl-tRNA(Sec) selenium transferase [Alphaproteobacteria bacterium]|nr:L-seryl-tRNA(Sec) selenium transferase [Alphaproteobacteria bacterium]